MRDLYLHIGLPKTGTSYIQRTLGQNADVLLADGIGVGPFIDRVDGESRRMRRAISARGLGSVMAELAASPGEKMVISSEHLSDALLDPRIALAVRFAAGRHFVPRIVVFLRRQDFLKESLFSQEVKNWYSGDIQGENTFDYDHDRRLADLEAVFGRENVRVLIYRDGGGNDILAAFFAALGTEVPAGRIREVGAQNVALHRRKLLFLSRVPKPDPAVQDVSMFLTDVVGRSRSIADDGGRFLMSPAERHALVARHLAGNRALLARHRIGDAGDFAALPDPDAEWRPPAPIRRSEYLAVCAEALARCFVAHPNRYSIHLARRLVRTLPEVGRRLFGPAAPWPAPSAPPSDMLPIADLDRLLAGGEG